MFLKIFIVVEVTFLNGNKSCYGKNKKEIPTIDDPYALGLYIKKYGCDSIEEAVKLQRKLELYFKKSNIQWRGFDLKDYRALFTDEDAKRFGFRPFLNFVQSKGET